MVNVEERLSKELGISLKQVQNVINLLDEHIQGKKDNSRKVWTVFMFCLWYEIYIEGKSIEELEKYNDFNRSDSKSKLA